MPDHAQIDEREGDGRPGGVLSESPAARPAESLEVLDHVERMITARPDGRVPVHLAPLGLIPVRFSLQSRQQLMQLAHIGLRYVGRQQAVGPPVTVGSDVRLHAKLAVLALLGLTHIVVTRSGLVFRRGRRLNNHRIHGGGGLTQRVSLVEEPAQQSRKLHSQLVLLQKTTEAQDRRLTGDRVLHQFDAGKAAHRLGVIPRILGVRVREVRPALHEINAQHPLQRHRLLERARLRLVRLDSRLDRLPEGHGIPLAKKGARGASNCPRGPSPLAQ